LHDDFLVLPNAWDAGSAGCRTSGQRPSPIALESLGRGYQTAMRCRANNCLPPHGKSLRHPGAAQRRHRGGYADDPSAVARLVSSVIDAGAVGINLETAPARPTSCARKSRRQAKRRWRWR
jgi:hypothetical protein